MKKFTIFGLIVLFLFFLAFNNMQQVRLHLFWGQYIEIRLFSLLLIVVIATITSVFLFNAYREANVLKKMKKNKVFHEDFEI